MQAPTAVANFPNEIVNFPRGWVQKQYNLKQWSVFDSGVTRAHLPPCCTAVL